MYKQQRAESPMVSLAQGNTLRKSALQLKIMLQLPTLVIDYFWPQAIFLLKISPKISSLQATKKPPTEHTENTDFVQRFSSRFQLRFTIGYFSRDSAKNKFLDLFSALVAPKIRASPMRSIIKSFPKARNSSAFSVEIFI